MALVIPPKKTTTEVGKKSTIVLPARKTTTTGPAPRASLVIPPRGSTIARGAADDEGFSVKKFIKNIPTYLGQGVTSAGDLAAKTGSTIGGALGNSAGTRAAVIRTAAQAISPTLGGAFSMPISTAAESALQRATGKNKGLAASAGSLKSTIEAPVVLPFQDEPIMRSADKFSGPAEAAGLTLEVGLDLLTALFGGNALKAVGKQALKEGTKATVKASLKALATKEGATAVAKTGLREAAVGFGYGTAVGAQDENATVGSVLRAGGTGALVNLALPAVLGGTYRVGRYGLEAGLKPFAKGADRLAGSLEGVATRAERELATAKKASSSLYPSIDTRPKSLIENVADTTARSIRYLQDVPLKAEKAFLNSLAYVGDLDKKIFKRMGVETDLMEAFQRTNSRAMGQAQTRLVQYVTATSRKYDKETWGVAKQVMMHLDAMDRAGSGQTIQGGKSLEDVTLSLAELKGKLSPEQTKRVGEAVAAVQSQLRAILREARDVGRISDKEYKNITEEHQNYIPHRVLDFIRQRESEAQITGGTSYSAAGLGFKEAKGSEREIADIDTAITDYIFQETYKNEKQNTVQALFDAITGKNGEVTQDTLALGFAPLRTKEQTLEMYRLATALKGRISEEREALRLLKGEMRNERKTVSAITEIERKLAKEENELAQDIEKFMQDGLMLKVDLTIPSKVRTMPNPLLADAYTAQRAGSFEAFSASEAGKRLVLNQDRAAFLQKYGFRNIKDFYEAASKPFKPEVTKTVERLVKGPQAIELVSGLRKKTGTEEKLAFKKEIDLPSARDAVANAKRNVEEVKKQKEAIHKAMDEVRIEKLKTVDVPEGFERFTRVNDGFKEEWLIPEEIALAMKSVDKSGIMKMISILKNTVVGKAFTFGTRATKALATKFSPVFAFFKNPARDLQTAKFTSKFTVGDLGKALIETITGHKHPEYDTLWRQASEKGAFLSSIYKEDDTPDAVLHSLQAKFGIVSRTLSEKAATPFRFFEAATQVLEETTRLATFRRALIDGKNPAEAAKIAANATVDFSKGGTLLKVLNQVSPFLNARVQGFLNLAKNANKNPERFTRQALVYAAFPAAVLYAHNDNYESYYNLPESTRRRNWVIMVGESDGKDYSGNFVKVPHAILIPRGEIQVAVASLVERVLGIGQEKHPQKTVEFLAALAGDITPVQDSSILPPGISHYWELKANYSQFRGREIVPDWVYVGGKWRESKTIDPKYQYSELSSSELAKALGKALNWSPYKIDYVIKTGVANDLVRLFDLGVHAAGRASAGEQVLTPSNLGSFEKAAEAPFIRSILNTSTYGATEGVKREEAEAIKEQNNRDLERTLGF